MEREAEINIADPKKVDIRDRIPKLERARVAEIYSRSVTEDRLNVQLPPDLHGEWVLNSELEIARKRGLGFVIDDQFATANAMHNDGTGKPVIGDVVYMITTTENKKMLDDIARDAYFEMHGSRADKEKKQKEEKDFLANSKGSPILPVTEVKGHTLSKQESVSGKEIIDSLPQT